MIKALIVIFILFGITGFALSQQTNSFQRDKLVLNYNKKIRPSESKASVSDVLLLAFPFNPIFIVEEGKSYLGFTKEVSFGTIREGNIGVEYSYIFRDENKNHLRISYNHEFAAVSGDIAALLASAGVGYFTDFNKKGFFPQLSINLLLTVFENVCAVPYIKGRYTFMTDKSEANIFDLSLGIKTAFYFRF
ncbi:MAG: hypothetical protein JSS63_03225 [Bacteroidetes bacterium]|nr:hypothetical protein [Bacteroidota bacterium]